MKNSLEIELTNEAFEMPRLASVGNPEVLSKRNAYFASLFQDREINDGNPKNLLQGHDEFLQDFKKAKEVLEQSNIWIPDPDTSNKNSYTNTRRKIFGNVIRDVFTHAFTNFLRTWPR